MTPDRPGEDLHNLSGSHLFRHAAESLVLLAIAVVLFRGFAVEGYLISTGSMAPTLLGYHHDVICPECGFRFARGATQIPDDEQVRFAQGAYDFGLDQATEIRCPNCSLTGIHFHEFPRTEGDQLLVHKHAYEFRDPRRWEVVVFRNPGDPRQAYVKRVAGLPGETISIEQGEVFANGQLCRKPYEQQHSMRVPVSRFENQLGTGDPDGQPGWYCLSRHSQWQRHEARLTFTPSAEQSSLQTDWIAWRHWIRAGGKHVSEVSLPVWPEDVDLPEAGIFPLEYRDGRLRCTGVLTDVDRRAWLARSDDPAFHAALEELAMNSHIAPVVDESGYNSVDDDRAQIVDEFCVTLDVEQISGAGRFEVQLADSENEFRAVFDFSRNEVSLLRNDDPVPVRQVPFTPSDSRRHMRLEFSLFDDQALLAVNGREVFEPFAYSSSGKMKTVTKPVQFGAQGLSCEVANLELSRDVYYVSRPDRSPGPITLKTGEFFVLGDNSPVSVDSRVWDQPAVPRSAFIGKPLVVHLPSTARRFHWNGTAHDVRLPDFSRARLIH